MKSAIVRLLYAARNLRARRLFDELEEHCRGRVLDVGGWDFVLTASRREVSFDTWTVLEMAARELPDFGDERIEIRIGDGCDMDFSDASFDTVLNIQVLEHVFEPNRMMEEMCRVLKPGGMLIMLLPQTSALHMIPHHYYNFTRYWIEQALSRNGMTQLKVEPLGGVWSSMASHLVYFFLQSFRYPGMSAPEFRRSWKFYALFPVMLFVALLLLPICLLLSLGDLSEEPNNHLVVARKPTELDVAPETKPH